MPFALAPNANLLAEMRLSPSLRARVAALARAHGRVALGVHAAERERERAPRRRAGGGGEFERPAGVLLHDVAVLLHERRARGGGVLGPGYRTRVRVVDEDGAAVFADGELVDGGTCLLYTSPSPRDKRQSRMPSSA